MDNSEKQFTEQDSLVIIQQMIQAAKQEQKDDGKGWIIWGWMLFLASVLTVLNMEFQWTQTYFFWNAFSIITLLFLVLNIIKLLFGSKREKVKTYTNDLFKKLNIGFFICIIFIIVAINAGVGPVRGFAFLINLYGFWILIYGSLLNFKPSIIGAFITWTIGFVSLFFSSMEIIMLLHAAAVLCGYIIPGHIANIQFKQTGKTLTNYKKSV